MNAKFLEFLDIFRRRAVSVVVGRVCPQAGITGTKPREAYGVRGACSRFRTAPHIRQREQAPRTPYASRDTTALVIRLCNLLRIPRKSAQKNKIFAYIIQRAAVFSRSWPGALRTDAPSPPSLTGCARDAFSVLSCPKSAIL